MTLNQRITTARQYAKKSKTDLAKCVGISKQAIGSLESGSTNAPTPENLFKIAKCTGVSAEWLVTGVEPMLVDKSEHTDDPRPSVQEALASYNNIKQGPEAIKKRPVLTWVQAGDFCDNSDSFGENDAQGGMYCPTEHSDKTYILIVKGPSMEPKYHDGDYIFVDPLKQPEHNSDVIVRLENSHTATFKRLQILGGKQYLIPINKTWPEPVIPLHEQAIICGVVIFAGRDI